MSDWSAGYVTDIPYTYGVYRELFPSMLGFAALASGFLGPDFNSPLTYCELGCGQGYTSNLVAAANPNIEVYANDFNPAHILGARALAVAAGTRNVHFFDSSFAEFAVDATLPDFDIIVLHGIYSWINVENRQHIVDFIRRRLRIGGLVYISYNALPAYASVMPLRRLLVDRAEAAHGSIVDRIEEAVAYARKLEVAGASYLSDPRVLEQFKKIKESGRDYVVHEYFNQDWTAFYHADVVADLNEAKLTYVGSAELLSSVDAVNLTQAQRALLATATTSVERETLRDYMLNQRFRRDIFVKGAVRLGPQAANARWMDMRFILSNGREDVPLTVIGARGEAELQREVYQPLLDTLANGARTVAELMTDPRVVAIGGDRLRQALTVLVGAGQLQPSLDEAGDAARAAGTKLFNRKIIEQSQSSEQWRFLASPIFGGPVHLGRVSQLFLLAHEDGVADSPEFVCDALMSQGLGVAKHDGTKWETREENLAALNSLFEIFNAKQLPLLRSLGVA